MAELDPIPGPPGLPFVGNARDVDPNNFSLSIQRLADIYGPIFRINLGGVDLIYVSSVELAAELLDESRFVKSVSPSQKELRAIIGNGLVTADVGNHEWNVAHRVLIPSFGPFQIRSMFDDQFDIASQLVMKWARHQGQNILVTDDYTRLALDSIALCTMGMRFNSFYTDEVNPFVKAMTVALEEGVRRGSRPSFLNYVLRDSQNKMQESSRVMRDIAQKVIDERKSNKSDKKDVLYHMLNSRDPTTKEKMTDEMIMNNMITFLIAGHETTSGLLSFLTYYFISNPEKFQTARAEIDRVIGSNRITVDHLSNVPYITACLRETLRLRPTATNFNLMVNPESGKEYEVIGGRYMIPKGATVSLVLSKIHRDPAVYGDDFEDFKPERMYEENFERLPNGAWKPFGNGSRACIGRPFAWEEALLVACLIVQNFDLRFADPNYKLTIKQALTIKPKDCYIFADLREGIDASSLTTKLFEGSGDRTKPVPPGGKTMSPGTELRSTKPMSIYFGSNSGTCEALSNSLSRNAAVHGFDATIEILDRAVNKLPTDRPVIIITCSYEGLPADNATNFVDWISKLDSTKPSLSGVKYAVFGCGNREWSQTYQKIPTLIGETLAANGAARLAEGGSVDVAGPNDPYTVFDQWMDEKLWPKIGTTTKLDAMACVLDIAIDTGLRPKHLRQDIYDGVVLSNEVLTVGTTRQKRHLEIRLPSGLEYKAGDYLVVLPLNHPDSIRRVLNYFQLPWDTAITVHPGIATNLPIGHPISLWDALAAYFELGQPASKKTALKLAEMTHDEAQKAQAHKWAGVDFDVEVTAKRRSPLDFFEEFPSTDISLGEFLTLLPPMRVREYSISSSPLTDPTKASITFSVLDEPSHASPSRRHLGVASNYLARLRQYDMLHIAIKQSPKFHLPLDPQRTALVLVCAGTGIAPFHGFLAERAAQSAGGRSLAPAYLFFGCHDKEQDALFAKELAGWENTGVVKVYWAYSSEGMHVQDRMLEERETLRAAFVDEAAKVYVCGSNAVGQAVADVVKTVYKDHFAATGLEKTEDEVEAWFSGVKNVRYVSDLFT